MTDKNNYITYIDDHETMNKIKNHDEMNNNDKLALREAIVSMTIDEQMEFFRFLVDILDYEFYSINGPKLIFNLASLGNETLWKLQYHIKLLTEDTNRKKLIDEATDDFNENVAKFAQNISDKLDNLQSASTNKSSYEPKLYTPKNIPSYQTLMDEALNQ